MHLNILTRDKMNHNSNGQNVLNDWTTVSVTVGKGGVYGMTERKGYENPPYLSRLRFKDTPSCSTKLCLSPHNHREKRGYRL